MPETWLGQLASILFGAAAHEPRADRAQKDADGVAHAAFINDLSDRMREDIGAARNPDENVRPPSDLGWPGVRGW